MTLHLILLLLSNTICFSEMSSRALYKVFVYGTLKRGEPNHHWFSKDLEGHHKFLYEARTKEKYPLIISTVYNVPFLLYSPGNGCNVIGEVYEVDDKVLANLDILEEHPDFYVRDLYDVVRLDNETITESVWIYFIKKFKPQLLLQEFYENYSSFGSHGKRYIERYLRDPSKNHRLEITGNEN